MILFADSEGPDQTANAQADQGIRCPHMPEETCLHGATQILLYLPLVFRQTDISEQTM